MRGRKPKSTAQKVLEGNPGRRPLNEDEPIVEAPGHDFQEPPTEIAKDAVAASEWRRLIPLLMRARQITKAERGSLIALCREWSRYIEAGEKVATHGMVVKTPNGYPIVNPYLSIGNKSLVHCTKLWAELGLTPSSRSRVSRVEGGGGPDDPFAEFDAPPVTDIETDGITH